MKTLAALVNEDALLRGLMKTFASLANEDGASRLIECNRRYNKLVFTKDVMLDKRVVKLWVQKKREAEREPSEWTVLFLNEDTRCAR